MTIVLNNVSSMEEMLSRIERTRKGKQQLPPTIAALKPGDCFVRMLPGFGVMIYGEIIEPPANVNLEKNQRWSIQSSTMCPSGEKGPVQLAAITAKISRVCFDACQAADWPATLEDFTKCYEGQLSVQ